MKSTTLNDEAVPKQGLVAKRLSSQITAQFIAHFDSGAWSRVSYCLDMETDLAIAHYVCSTVKCRFTQFYIALGTKSLVLIWVLIEFLCFLLLSASVIRPIKINPYVDGSGTALTS